MDAQPTTPTTWPDDVRTLSVDVGGSGFKASVLDSLGQMVADRVRVDTPYPCTPERFVEEVSGLVAGLPSHHRASVGFPGLVRSGRVVHVPSLSRREYGGPEDPELATMWRGFDLAGPLARAFRVPTKVANDADVQGCAVVRGDGFEFVMTLGTGCGTALFDNGRLLPHIELSHAPFRKKETYDIQLGNAARKEIGNDEWAKRVVQAIESFDSWLYFDRIYVGGGNAKHLGDAHLGAKAEIVPNTAGILGGIRIWDLER